MKDLVIKGGCGFEAVALGAVLILFGISDAWAQQERKISWKALGENTEYTQQYVIDVQDMLGH